MQLFSFVLAFTCITVFVVCWSRLPERSVLLSISDLSSSLFAASWLVTPSADHISGDFTVSSVPLIKILNARILEGLCCKHSWRMIYSHTWRPVRVPASNPLMHTLLISYCSRSLIKMSGGTQSNVSRKSCTLLLLLSTKQRDTAFYFP